MTNPNNELLSWAVENIKEWDDDYTHLRSDNNSYNSLFYTNGTSWKRNDITTEWECNNDEYTAMTEDFSKLFSTDTPQVITKEEWSNGVLLREHAKIRVACDTVLETPPTSPSEAQQGHVHASIMAEYALVAKTNPEPWREFEVLNSEAKGWEDLEMNPRWFAYAQYRRKPTPPKTMNIGGIVVEAWPLEEPLELDASYYMLSEDQGYFCADLEHWDGNEFDFDRLNAGKLFKTREECVAVADALNLVYNRAIGKE